MIPVLKYVQVHIIMKLLIHRRVLEDLFTWYSGCHDWTLGQVFKTQFFPNNATIIGSVTMGYRVGDWKPKIQVSFSSTY